jgi:hypothetical protein
MNTDPQIDLRAHDGEWTVTARHLGDFVLVVDAGPFPSGSVSVSVTPPPEGPPALSLDTPSAEA